jgi:conjugative relaxase-like TrwC/TraI family protein
MITGRPQKNLNTAKTYFRKHLTCGDYHSEHKTVQGYWFGKGAERLGLNLNSPVAEKEFLRLCDNQHPVTGKLLTVRNRKKERRVFYDFVASAPKSVSIMALTVGDSRIATAHDEAARIALTRMEKAAASRVRKKGQRTERPTGEITAAVFRHQESRALDPQLHTHFVVFNATFDPVEKRWKALETSTIYDRIKFFTEVYRSELAFRLKQMGYQVRNTDHGFEIEGVTPEMIERFSKRRRAILKAEAELTGKPGETLSNNARAAVSRATRPHKRTDLTDDDIIAYQRTQVSAGEMEVLRNLTQAQLNDAPPEKKISAQAAIDYAVEHLFERNSEVEIADLLEAALKYGQGDVRLEQLEKELAQRTEFIRFRNSLTTKEALQQEQRLIALVNQGLGGCQPLFPGFKADERLSGEERQAFEFLLHSPDEVVALRGWAGTGKTTLLQKLLGTIETQYEAVILAPTAAAVDELRQRGLKQAATVHRFLSSPDFQERSRGRPSSWTRRVCSPCATCWPWLRPRARCRRG